MAFQKAFGPEFVRIRVDILAVMSQVDAAAEGVASKDSMNETSKYNVRYTLDKTLLLSPK
ncbi:MAG TPA: hypothetical protein VFO40_27660 [Chthoniobacterales bacterium]|nr:hypothetical protein [Chthoniobacterales bacterium]